MSKKTARKHDEQNQPKSGELVTKSVSFRKYQLEELEAYLKEIKEKTGYTCTRSKLITLQAEILLKAQKYLSVSKILDNESFKAEIINAIKELG